MLQTGGGIENQNVVVKFISPSEYHNRELIFLDIGPKRPGCIGWNTKDKDMAR